MCDYIAVKIVDAKRLGIIIIAAAACNSNIITSNLGISLAL